MTQKNVWSLQLAIVLVALVITDANFPTCDPIQIELCRGLGYNVTRMPNLLGHELQQDAELQLQTFTPLIQYGCSTQLRLFLCSVYVPMCTDKVPEPIGPCRSLCESVRSKCQPVLEEFGFLWPSSLSCIKFPPENNQQHMCIEGTKETTSKQDPVFPPYGGRRPKFRGSEFLYPTRPYQPLQTRGSCANFKKSEMYVYINRTESCMPLCNANILFKEEDKQFTEVWITVWSMLCFLTTLVTFLTYVIDSSQFQFPEKIVIFIAMNYNIYSIGHLVRILMGRDVMACITADIQTTPVLIQQGLAHTNCVIVFLLRYYFEMAANVWWIILSLTWYLSRGLHFNHESVERLRSIFHAFAWGLPAAQTVAATVMNIVDADELTGTCYVGNSNLTTFVLIPRFVYLVCGAGLFLVGCQQTKPEEKSSVASIRIGVYGFMYAIPAVCVFAIDIYECINQESWLRVDSDNTPNLKIFMLKVFMNLIIGIASGLWIWTKKTVTIWMQLGKKLTYQHQPSLNYSRNGPNKQVFLNTALMFVKRGGETEV